MSAFSAVLGSDCSPRANGLFAPSRRIVRPDPEALEVSQNVCIYTFGEISGSVSEKLCPRAILLTPPDAAQPPPTPQELTVEHASPPSFGKPPPRRGLRVVPPLAPYKLNISLDLSAFSAVLGSDCSPRANGLFAPSERIGHPEPTDCSPSQNVAYTDVLWTFC